MAIDELTIDEWTINELTLYERRRQSEVNPPPAGARIDL
jgi:hypothetical protein